MKLDWALLAKSAFTVPGYPPSILAAGMTAVAALPRDRLPPGSAVPDDAASGPIQMALVTGLLASRAEIGRQPRMEVTIVEIDGNERFKYELPVAVPVAPPDLPAGTEIPIHVIFEINWYPARIETHTVNIFIDGGLAKTIPLIVKLIS